MLTSISFSCVLLFLIGLASTRLVHRPVAWFLEWLRGKSDFRDPRPKPGVPHVITGTFERALAFILVLSISFDKAVTVLGIWLGLKLAANWQAMPKDEKTSREVRVGTLTALMAGVVSVSLGVSAGLIARWGCGLCE